MAETDAGPRDSEKITAEEYAARCNGAHCEYDGREYPPGATVCMLGKSGDYTYHMCIDGMWVSTGVRCEP